MRPGTILSSCSGLFPAIFLGLGMLAKGPLPHLLFFYGPVIAVLWNDRKLSLLATREHGTALIIMFGMFVAWALPAFLLSDWGRVAHIWSRQYTGRVSATTSREKFSAKFVARVGRSPSRKV